MTGNPGGVEPASNRVADPVFVGVDVGGTNIKIAVVSDQGEILKIGSIATLEERGPEDAFARLKPALERLLADCQIPWDRVPAIGLGTPGPHDLHRGIMLDSPNLPHWHHFPVKKALSDLCDRPVAYVNDANAAAFGEFWLGAGRNDRSLVMFTLGTGVGGGIILNGVSIDGQNSFGSEVGHVIIDCRDDARLCVWGGGRGQLEAFASASALTARALERLKVGAISTISKRIDAGEQLTAKLLYEAAEAGDKFAADIILETADYLAVGIVNVVHLVDPGLIVIGGAMTFGRDSTATGRAFLARVREVFARRAFDVVVKGTRIEFAAMGGDAGVVGAAGIARAEYRRQCGMTD